MAREFLEALQSIVEAPRSLYLSYGPSSTSGTPLGTTKLQVLLGKGLHLQARPDDSHGRSTKDAGDIYKPDFDGRLFFNLSRCWFFSTSSCAWLRPALHGRRLRLDNFSRPLCHPRHKFFDSGGWTAASFSWPAHRVPVLFFPLINRVGRGNLLRQLRSQLSAYKNTSSQVLDYSTRGAHLLRRSLGHLQLLGDSLARHIARPPRRRRETSLQASRRSFDKRNVGQPRSAEPGPQL
jgi:hypothetical protein